MCRVLRAHGQQGGMSSSIDVARRSHRQLSTPLARRVAPGDLRSGSAVCCGCRGDERLLAVQSTQRRYMHVAR